MINYWYLNVLNIGVDRSAYNVISGHYKGNYILYFDCSFFPPFLNWTKDLWVLEFLRKKYTFSAAIIHLSKSFPELIMIPEGIIHKMTQSIGLEDIDFDNIEFSKKFDVKCRSKKFAYEIFHPQMMNLIVGLGDISFEIEKETMIIFSENRTDPEEMKSRLDMLVAIREKFPEYLFSEDSYYPNAIVFKDVIEPKITFPIIVECPVCAKNIRIPNPGKIRCPSCKSISQVDGKGMVQLKSDGTEISKIQFPIASDCPSCGMKIRFKHEGEYRCPKCKKLTEIDAWGEMTQWD